MDISKITRVRGMKKRAVYMYLAMCLALALSVTGCSKKTVSSDGVRTVEKDYTKGQIMVVAATERNRYQNIYTSQLWSVKADDSGATFEEKLLGQIEQFLIELGTTNLMADEQGIELTGQEKDSLKALAKEYYRGLSEQDRDYMGVTESEVYDLYCEYYRADKLVAELTRDENLEVSDAEAKVIQVQQIVLDSRERAEDILSQVQQENADFANIANGRPVTIGEAVGIISAQSIGEPGTQLTMRTFHTGGIANAEDITQGLPRVEELFEARRPKQLAIMTEIAGIVHVDDTKKNRHIVVSGVDENGAPAEKSYMIPFGQRVRVAEGDMLEKGDMITEGNAYPQDILAIKGVAATEDYIIQQVQMTYRMQGVDINDKHIEVIVHQMMRKARVDDSGSTDLIGGALADKQEIEAKNAEIRQRIAAGETDLQEAKYTTVLLGITKASLATDSFLSAASFQETTRVLTEAAIKGKVDPLMGLKENVIIGKLIPAGTGLGSEEDAEEFENIEGSSEVG